MAVLGRNAVINYKVDGVGGAGSWVELKQVRDVTMNETKDEADVSTRDSYFKQTLPTGADLQPSFELVAVNTDAGYLALRASWAAQDEAIIGLQIMDGPAATGKGWEGDFTITGFTQSQALNDAVKVQVVAKLASTSTPPVFVVPA